MKTIIKKCKVTKKEMYDTKLVNTLDGHPITLDVYHLVSNELRTGLFTLKQAQETYKRITKGTQDLLNHIVDFNKMAITKKLKSSDYLKSIVDMEQELSIKKYKAYGTTLGRKEHYNVMTEIFQQEQSKVPNTYTKEKLLNGNDNKGARAFYLKDLGYNIVT